MQKSANLSNVIKPSVAKTLLITSLLSLSIVLNSCATGSVTSATPDAKFKEQVLQVIKENPQVVIDSVQAYQKQQEEQANNARQEILTKLRNNPASIIENSPQMGAKDGKIVLVEFSDFQCPFCAKAQPTIKEFMAKHGDQVTLVFKHLPLVRIHPEAIPASAASWAAQQQGKFWEYHNALFEQQEKLGEELYVKIAQDLALNMEKFNSDRKSPEAIKAIEADVKLAQTIGIQGTPFFVMNGEPISGAVELSEFEATLEKVKK